jgi:hypothetical protein
MKLRIIPNAIYVFLVCHRIDAMHVGLKETPFCPMFCTKLKEPCSFIKVPHGPYIYFPNNIWVLKERTQLYISVLISLGPSRMERDHRVLATEKKLAQVAFHCFDYAPSTPDLAPYYYYLFPGLKKGIEREVGRAKLLSAAPYIRVRLRPHSDLKS